jgi:D-glycero-alpha-D-manno-heptose 1-phosphate guanylyltransferase
MAPINDRPFIEYLLDYLISYHIRKFIFSVGYKHETFVNYFTNDYRDCPILYSVEQELLGTGGGIRKAMAFAETSEVLVMNADTFFRIDVPAMYKSHKNTDADITIGLRQTNDVSRYGCVEIDKDMHVTGFAEKKSITGKGFINGGIYIIKRRFFEGLSLPKKFSLEKDCLEKYFGIVKICGFPSDAYFLDIGVPEDYKKAQHDFKRL